MQLTTKKITKPDAQFWKDFDELVENTCRFTVQLNSIWLSNFIKYHFKEHQEVYIVAVYQKNKLVGCLPLQLSKVKATKFYSFHNLRILGYGPTDFYDLPIQEEGHQEIIKELVNYLIADSGWDHLTLSEIPESSQHYHQFLDELNSSNYKIKKERHNGFQYVETVGDWEEYLEKQFQPKNKDLAKSERRILRKEYELKFTSYRENVYEQLLKNIDLYAQRRESLGQLNNYETDNLKNFLKNIIDQYEQKKMVELTVLEANNEVWAFQLDWLKNNTRFHWNHAYNEDYKRYSPGKVILKELMRTSFNSSSIEACNHMRGLSSYKDKFTENKEYLLLAKIENRNSFRLKLHKAISKILKMIKS